MDVGQNAHGGTVAEVGPLDAVRDSRPGIDPVHARHSSNRNSGGCCRRRGCGGHSNLRIPYSLGIPV